MPLGNIDYDRGVLIKQHQLTGMEIFMYVDEPGKYLSAFSNPVDDNLAREAGYDIEKLAKDRLKKERKAQAVQLIEDELSDDKDVGEDLVKERNGFKIITTGLGRHHVIDPEGNRLTPTPISEEIADRLFNSMAGSAVEEKKTK